jgi:hypothetical protein
MSLAVPHILKLVERMEAPKASAFRLAPRSWCAHACRGASQIKVERWDLKGAHVEEIVASANLIMFRAVERAYIASANPIEPVSWDTRLQDIFRCGDKLTLIAGSPRLTDRSP